MSKIQIYDTTLRDGSQAEDVNFSTEDKIRIAHRLDELGVDYVEGGWPGSNPTDKRFFQEIANYDFKHSRVSAFGSTCNPKNRPEDDPNLESLLDAKTQVLTIFGKTWDLHVKDALRVEPEKNLEIIGGSLAYLRPKIAELFFDCEHFFDGFKSNPAYALACLRAAHEATADVLVLCDTNGGGLPHELAAVIERVKTELPDAKLGVHAHNDCELAVANSVAAVHAGCVQVQGTMNGYGERCGNANLTSIVPILELKMGLRALPEGHLSRLTDTCRFIDEIANLQSFARQPFVGRSAFAHKGGVHVSAVMRNAALYEHIKPEAVGNKQRVLLSDLSGKSNILLKARQFGFDLDKDDPFVQELLTEVKRLESQGYEFASAEASFELLLNRTLGRARNYFSLVTYRILDTRRVDCEDPLAEATIMVKVGGVMEHTAATGRGPVNALDNALRKALERFYPKLAEMRLLDFKVRVMSAAKDKTSTAANVRVLIESGDQARRWTTVGVSSNIIEASWQALEDSVNYKLFIEDREKLTRALRG